MSKVFLAREETLISITMDGGMTFYVFFFSQQRVKERGRKRSQDLWPQAKQVELTLGRRWRCPNDFFNDEMIAEVLSSQAEVIRGRALG